ncbi:MAG TPA: branched-chain amino acid ABC transporter [Firmicutes bacterium]|jgi:branched-chain amino acid transport system permease protein|nr:branched-chain amino acid ABC transporter [Bacillota bacterium]
MVSEAKATVAKSIGTRATDGKQLTRGAVALGGLAAGYFLVVGLHRAGVLISDYYLQILIWVGINTIMGVSLNLINGFTGQFSLGHAGFMAIGAYVAAYMTKILGAPFAPALLVGGTAAALGGLVVGIPALRLAGDYLAIATLGFGEIIRVIILNLDVVGGPRGLPGIPAHTTFLWVYAMAAATVVIVRNLIWSRQGRALVAIREDETAAETMGVDTTRYKIMAFVVGAFFAGVAGGLYAHKITFIDPSQFDFMKSIEALVIIVLGGLGSITGTVLAAFVVTFLPEALRAFADYRMIIYSLMLILMMLYRPRGLMGTAEFGFRQLGLGDARSSARDVGGQAMGRNDGPPPVLETRGVCMDFGGLRAVSDFCMTLRQGELVGLIGPNGAGKTTVFNVLTGLSEATCGSVHFMGNDITRKRPSEINDMGIARTFQNIRLFSNLTVLDNVRIAFRGERPYSMTEAVLRAGRYSSQEEEICRKSMEFLRLFGLDDRASEIAGKLPYGAQRRLEMARALATGPKLLLLDEPAAGMNPQETHELLELIRWIHERFDLTVLLIEHDMNLVMKLCQRIIVLDYGNTIADDAPADIVKNRRVIDAYLGEEAV